jgi:hypothetical protein
MLDISAFSAGLKQLYPEWKIAELTYKNNPLYAMMKKNENFVGEVMKIPLIYGNPVNRSGTFSSALAGTSSSLLKAFLLTRKSDYSLATINNEALEASASMEGAFMEASKLEIDGALRQLARSHAIKLFRSGTGAIGVVKAATSPTTTVELQTIQDVTNFEVGYKLNASVSNGGGSLRADKPKITAINRAAGTMTVDATVAGSWVAGDYIFVDGDYDTALSGLDAWIPYDDRSARLAATYYNVVRTADEVRLGGVIYDGSGSNYEEALIDGLNLAYNIGDANIDHVFMNPIDVSVLTKILGSKVQRVQVSTEVKEGDKSMAVVSFDGIEIFYSGGKCNVIGDRNCPKGRAFGLQMDGWSLNSIGSAVRLFEADGLKMLRSSTADALDIRAFGYLNASCNAPGHNVQIKLA